MEEKIDFWYESNSYFGRIKNLEDLRIAMLMLSIKNLDN